VERGEGPGEGSAFPLLMVQFLEISLPGFTWLSVSLFLIGLVESFLYGVYADVPLYNFLSRRGQPIQ
jgi:hypothetical protein